MILALAQAPMSSGLVSCSTMLKTYSLHASLLYWYEIWNMCAAIPMLALQGQTSIVERNLIFYLLNIYKQLCNFKYVVTIKLIKISQSFSNSFCTERTSHYLAWFDYILRRFVLSQVNCQSLQLTYSRNDVFNYATSANMNNKVIISLIIQI